MEIVSLNSAMGFSGPNTALTFDSTLLGPLLKNKLLLESGMILTYLHDSYNINLGAYSERNIKDCEIKLISRSILAFFHEPCHKYFFKILNIIIKEY
jgi:hypothetical protein